MPGGPLSQSAGTGRRISRGDGYGAEPDMSGLLLSPGGGRLTITDDGITAPDSDGAGCRREEVMYSGLRGTWHGLTLLARWPGFRLRLKRSITDPASSAVSASTSPSVTIEEP